MENTRKVFIGWGYDKDGDVRNCGEFSTIEEAEQAVANAGLPLAEVETEYRKPLTMETNAKAAASLSSMARGSNKAICKISMAIEILCYGIKEITQTDIDDATTHLLSGISEICRVSKSASELKAGIEERE